MGTPSGQVAEEDLLPTSSRAATKDYSQLIFIPVGYKTIKRLEIPVLCGWPKSLVLKSDC